MGRSRCTIDIESLTTSRRYSSKGGSDLLYLAEFLQSGGDY